MTLLLLAALACLPARAVPDPATQASLREGLSRLYDLDYPAARAAFRKVVETQPDSPFGYLFESGAIWWQADTEYGLFKDTPTLQGLFEEDVEAAIRKADAWTDEKDKERRADGHFALGMALGTRGEWDILRGRWLSAYFDGKKAVKHLKKCLKIDKDYSDAWLGLGIFDYEAARFGGLLKFGAMIGGVRGDEKKGLERIQFAAKSARFASKQAAQFLSTIYIQEKGDYEQGLPIIQGLRAEFPASPYFAFLEAALQHKLGHPEESLKAGRDVFSILFRDPAAFKPKLLSLACALSGERCLSKESATQALDWFDRALAAETPGSARRRAAPEEAARRSTFHLFRGYAHDVLEQREEAEIDYRWVLSHRNFGDNRARASECLESPCAAQPLLRYLRTLSKDEPWPPVSLPLPDVKKP